ncbi:MAG: SDR family oxidoreductase [Bacillota bacterium]
MKVLVTGASGHVGRFVVQYLLEKGEEVVAAGTNPDRLESLFNESVETVRLDLTDEKTFDQAIKDVDRVFLMRPPHLGKAEALYPFIDRMKTHGIKLVAFLSLMGVQKNPFPPHHKIEKHIKKENLPYAFIRPGFFMQNLIGIHAEEIREYGKIFIPAGKSKTSFIDTLDIGKASAVLLHEWESYRNTTHTLTGPESLNYYDIATILSRVLDKPITYARPGLLKYRRVMTKERGLDKGYVNVTMMLYLMTRLGTAKRVTDDFTRLTGESPRTFETFAREHKAHFMK